MTLEVMPKEIVSNRESIEGNFVMSLWADPDIYEDYKVELRNETNKEPDLLTEDGVFYYLLGLEMVKKGYKVFDDVTIQSYLSTMPKTRDRYELKGGFHTIKNMIALVDTANIDAYYDDFCKNNMLIQYWKHGYDVIKNIDKFNQMTSDQVYDYWDFLNNSIAIDKATDVKIEDLLIDEKMIEEWNSGEDMGINYGKIAHILNYATLGIPKGDLFLIGGFSGIGKTSWTFECMLMPALANGSKVCIISNEQRSKDFRRLLLIHVLTHDLKYYGLTRKKMKQGAYTQEQIEKIKEAKKIMEEKYSDNLRFVKMYDYNVSKIKKVVKKLSKVGFDLFLYDTMKGEALADGSVWQRIVEDSKTLFQLASKENIGFVATYQLALHSLNRRFLDAQCLSNAKQLKEVFSEMVYFRAIRDDEFGGERFDIKPYNWKKDESTGKYTKIKQIVELDVDKKYIIGFLDKTRNDEDKQTIVYEFNGAFNKWREIGYCTVHQDF